MQGPPRPPPEPGRRRRLALEMHDKRRAQEHMPEDLELDVGTTSDTVLTESTIGPSRTSQS